MAAQLARWRRRVLRQSCGGAAAAHTWCAAGGLQSSSLDLQRCPQPICSADDQDSTDLQKCVDFALRHAQEQRVPLEQLVVVALGEGGAVGTRMLLPECSSARC